MKNKEYFKIQSSNHRHHLEQTSETCFFLWLICVFGITDWRWNRKFSKNTETKKLFSASFDSTIKKPVSRSFLFGHRFVWMNFFNFCFRSEIRNKQRVLSIIFTCLSELSNEKSSNSDFCIHFCLSDKLILLRGSTLELDSHICFVFGEKWTNHFVFDMFFSCFMKVLSHWNFHFFLRSKNSNVRYKIIINSWWWWWWWCFEWSI